MDKFGSLYKWIHFPADQNNSVEFLTGPRSAGVLETRNVDNSGKKKGIKRKREGERGETGKCVERLKKNQCLGCNPGCSTIELIGTIQHERFNIFRKKSMYRSRKTETFSLHDGICRLSAELLLFASMAWMYAYAIHCG